MICDRISDDIPPQTNILNPHSNALLHLIAVNIVVLSQILGFQAV